MLPKTHIFLGAIISFFILMIFPQIGWLNALIIFLSSVILDVDHCLYYAVKKRDLSLKRAYSYFVMLRNKGYCNSSLYKQPILIFHGIEFCLVLLVLSIFSSFFLWILIGFLIHMVLDYTEAFYFHQSLASKFSQIYALARNKNRKELR